MNAFVIALAFGSFLAGATSAWLVFAERDRLARIVRASPHAYEYVESGAAALAQGILYTVTAMAIFWALLYAFGPASPKQPEAASHKHQARQVENEADQTEAPWVARHLVTGHKARLKRMLSPFAEADQERPCSEHNNRAAQVGRHGAGDACHQRKAAYDGQRDVPAVRAPVDLHLPPPSSIRRAKHSREVV